jgi:uncharacterized protein
VNLPSDGQVQPLIACLHLPPSPGCRGFGGRAVALSRLTSDLEAAIGAGVDGILLENENDKPHSLTVSTPQVAWLTFLAMEARRQTVLPLGIGVQRIDWQATLAVAAAAALDMVRLDVFVDRVRMQGEVVEIEPSRVRDLRQALGAEGVSLWVDVHVKHAELLGDRPLAQSVDLAIEQGAGAVLITGERTGQPPTTGDLEQARHAAAGRAPIFVASGLDPDNAMRLRSRCDGAIVGTSLKVGDALSPDRAGRMVAAWKAAR